MAGCQTRHDGPADKAAEQISSRPKSRKKLSIIAVGALKAINAPGRVSGRGGYRPAENRIFPAWWQDN